VTTLVAVVVGAAIGAAGWWALTPVLRSPVLLRENHRGAPVPTAGGLVLVPACLAVAVVGVVVAHHDPSIAHPWTRQTAAVAVLGLGLGLLGFVDDVVGGGESGGFRGHFAALRHGRMTSGLLKLAGGSAVCFIAVSLAPAAARSGSFTYNPGTSPGRLLLDAALVALAANLGNLLDRAPGRAAKVGLAAAAVLLPAAVLVGRPVPVVAVVVGAAAVLIVPDLGERVMLGDTGANVLGGILGLGSVYVLAPTARTAVVLVLLALNLASEVVSFSRVIDRVAPLRWADRAGRRR
jgi:UDP-N-acetylmuramyl pentapeptide phosphotransferase/UDP-N-acetylglucosamine-1-phosphate transferase